MPQLKEKLAREEILEMPAGPKMNEQMAILVKGWEPHPTGDPKQWFNLPNYSGDHVLALEVESHIDKLANFQGNIVVHITKSGDSTTQRGFHLRETYVERLMEVTSSITDYEKTTMGHNNWLRHNFRSDELWALIHATPLQRCQAALLTVQ